MPFLRAQILLAVPLLFLGACERETPRVRPTADDFGDVIVRKGFPRRIVSLVPATTDLIFALGAGDRLVGRTPWDEWPPAARAVPHLGPGVRPDVETVLAAQPDHRLLYASADARAAVQRLRDPGGA